MLRASVRSILLLTIAAFVWLAWYLLPRPAAIASDSATELLRNSVREARQTTEHRIRAARLRVDSAHERNVRAVARRAKDRSNVAARKSQLPAYSANPDTARVRCVQLLRTDDRLVRSLVDEIDDTRNLMGDYEVLSAAYAREVAGCDVVLADCRRAARRGKARRRTLVAAAAIVALVIVLD